MDNLEAELMNLYPGEEVSEEDARHMASDLNRFFRLCIQIAEQDKSPSNVQGNQQKYVQNVKFMEE
mgnify:CR=1 FL=1